MATGSHGHRGVPAPSHATLGIRLAPVDAKNNSTVEIKYVKQMAWKQNCKTAKMKLVLQV